MTRVAAIQMTSGPDIGPNLHTARQLLEQAHDHGARLAVLPEYFARFGLPEAERVATAEVDGDGPVQDFLAQCAAELDMWIVGGSLPIRASGDTAGERTRGACLVFDADGRRVARFDKQYLFDVHVPGRDEHYEESSWTEPGEPVAPIETPFGRLGVAICYDIRFPEMLRWQSAQGVDLFSVPAAFTATTGKAHWELLLRARAVENLAYVVAAGQAGEHPNGRKTWGQSMIVDPWGIPLDSLEQSPGVAIADMDSERLQSIREHFPALEHRRDIG